MGQCLGTLSRETAEAYATPIGRLIVSRSAAGHTFGLRRPADNIPTLFMLVSALMGLNRMQAAYKHAIESGYRFYSYGDGSLLLPRNGPAAL